MSSYYRIDVGIMSQLTEIQISKRERDFRSGDEIFISDFLSVSVPRLRVVSLVINVGICGISRCSQRNSE